MTTQSELRRSEFGEVAVRYEQGGGAAVTYVYRRAPPRAPEWEPWVVVAPSAILARLGLRGLGLYNAGRALRRDDYIGQYPQHDVVGRYPTREAALASRAARRRLACGRDKLITMRAPQGGGVLLCDGEGGGPPHVERVNDPRGTALGANAALTDGGWLRVLHARVPAFDLEKPLEDNIQSELRISYSDEYWDLHDTLGSQD